MFLVFSPVVSSVSVLPFLPISSVEHGLPSTAQNKQTSRSSLMLLPCSLQLDLMGQKVIFGITPQLLLFLTCSQTSATPCPTWHWENCPYLPAASPPPPPRTLSLLLLLPLEVAPVSLRAFLDQPDADLPLLPASRGAPRQANPIRAPPRNAPSCTSLTRERPCGAPNSSAQTQRTLKASSSHTCLTHPIDPIATGEFHSLPTTTNSWHKQ